MPVYRILRLKETQQQHFRWAPQTGGPAQVRRKDYEPAGEVEAPGIYAAWSLLRLQNRPLRVGDLLECGEGELRICKYVGLEEAHWVSPEAKDAPDQAVAGNPAEPRPPQTT